jgi:serine O-acetyltransferase
MIVDLLQTLRRDARQYRNLGGWYRCLGFWIGGTHRIRSSVSKSSHPVIALPLRLSARIVALAWENICSVVISNDAEIGPGLCLIHAHNIWIGGASIGRNCLIFHDVTIGTNANASGLPQIGNNVDIYVGAKLLGAIKIGDDAKIGANCAVTQSLAPGATVVTAANRVIPPSMVAAFGPRPSETSSGYRGDSSSPLRTNP